MKKKSVFPDIVSKDLDTAIKFLKNEIDSALDVMEYKSGIKFDEVNKKIDNLVQRIDLLPTRDDFFNKMDKLLKEIEEERNENALIEHKIKRIERHFPQILAS